MKYISIVLAGFLLFGCSGEKKEEQQTKANTNVETKVENNVKEKVEEKVEEKAKPVAKQEEKKVVKEVAKTEPKPQPKPKVAKLKPKQEVKTATKEVKKAEVKKVVKKTPAAVKKPAVDAASLYAKCSGCHGPKADRKAMGKTEIISKWDAKKIEDALKGYRANKRNVYKLGTIMNAQAKNLSDEEIKALAEYISKM